MNHSNDRWMYQCWLVANTKNFEIYFLWMKKKIKLFTNINFFSSKIILHFRLFHLTLYDFFSESSSHLFSLLHVTKCAWIKQSIRNAFRFDRNFLCEPAIDYIEANWKIKSIDFRSQQMSYNKNERGEKIA